MQLRIPPALVLALVCLAAACGGGGNALVPRPTSAGGDNGGPAVARTPFGANVRPAGSPSAAGPAATPAPAAPAAPQTYTVVAGDTPNAIAAKLNVPSDRVEAWVQQLLTMNNTTASGLQIGQVLRLPPGASTAPGPAPGPPASATRTPAGTPSATNPVIIELTSPVKREQEAILRVRAGGGQGCSPTHLLPNGGVSGAAGLGPKTADAGGNVSWTFTVPANTPAGEGVMRIICAGNVVAAPLVVN